MAENNELDCQDAKFLRKRPANEDEMEGTPECIDPEQDIKSDSNKPVIKKPRIESGKNPISLLNELCKVSTYTLISTNGPSHSPTFVMEVMVNGEVFRGEGGSKQLAKAAAAELALAAFMASSSNNTTEHSCTLANKAVSDTTFNDRNPVMVLNEVAPTSVFNLMQETGDAQSKTFVIEVTLPTGHKFYGSGKNKKIAKIHAAKTALESYYSYSFPVTPGSNSVKPGELTPGPRIMTSTLADRIANLIEDKYLELVSDQPERFSKYKVLAGIVMVTDDIDKAEIIVVTTGTKCASGDCMSLLGGALNDCHAEILARRGLCSFFYQQLMLSPFSDSIFEVSSQSDGESGNDRKMFKLKDNISFHLYISTAPCGDGRIFSSLDDAQDDRNFEQRMDDGSFQENLETSATSETQPCEPSPQRPDRHPNRLARGLLRVKIESGEGTIPVKTRGVKIQTWDGIMAGERLLTMSCSDKIVRWNVLGLQGSLLSNYLVDPVYLSSIIVASAYHSEHLTRAVYGRIETCIAMKDLPDGYRLNKPSLCTISNPGIRKLGKSPGHAGIWITGDSSMEIVDASSGLLEKQEGSVVQQRTPSLAKCELFKQFLNVWQLHGPPRDSTATTEMPKYYGEAKVLAEKHQQAKLQLFEAFKVANLGAWIERPIEHDQFSIGVD